MVGSSGLRSHGQERDGQRLGGRSTLSELGTAGTTVPEAIPSAPPTPAGSLVIGLTLIVLGGLLLLWKRPGQAA